MFNPIIGPLPTFLLSLGGAGPAQPWHHPGGGGVPKFASCKQIIATTKRKSRPLKKIAPYKSTLVNSPPPQKMLDFGVVCKNCCTSSAKYIIII